jgi:hypothetical protein
MNFYIISGILLIALGTGMMVYGQHVKSKVDSAEVQNKVDDVLKRIDEVRGGEKNEASAGKINQIEQEFETWAADFLKDRERRKVELARTHLDSIDVELKVTNEWSPVFEYVKKTIEAMAHAYNIKSGETIKVIFPPLPTNLYSDEANEYSGKVIFPNKVVWRISFSSTKPARENHPPKMHIFFQIEGKQHYEISFLSIQYFDQKTFAVFLNGPNVPIAEGIEGIYPFESYRESMKTIVQRLFEAQLLRD